MFVASFSWRAVMAKGTAFRDYVTVDGHRGASPDRRFVSRKWEGSLTIANSKRLVGWLRAIEGLRQAFNAA